MSVRFVTPEEAAALVPDGATVGLVGGGGGLMEPTLLHEHVEKRFLSSGRPHALTCVHALGIGDRESRGMNRFAHAGMVRRVIGGHWVWSPRMQRLADENKIEAYALPAGVIMQLMREVAAKRPGLITHVGLGTFVDPLLDGGRMNDAATEPLVERIVIDGKDYLRYLPIPVDIALLKGSIVDDDGNISLDEEPANLDVYAMAAAAHNSGGTVIFQVKRRVPAGSLPARSVRIPSAIVDAVVVDPDQRQSYDIVYDPSISGESRYEAYHAASPEFSVRLAIARRAEAELRDGTVINFGFGIPDQVASIVASEARQDRYYQTIEHGTYGGALLTGELFGYARNPSSMIDAPSQFDFYSGGGLDIAFLGFGQIDVEGNVNVSKLDGVTVGPGGFIDIAQNSRKVVFCGAFDAKGTEIKTGDGKLELVRPGEIRKFVESVDQITFSGKQALLQGQEVLYVTERAVFRLSGQGLELTETAPGVDLQKDVIEQMDFKPLMPTPPTVMDTRIFVDGDRG
ncbi:MAG: CoA-transferase [Dehalococcoidia bacterium]|jgi:propionate CoA-transferase|nr:CoA-transferase [Dehalococcoidia bacterium]